MPTCFLIGSLIICAQAISGQSVDQTLPTPVLSNEISGTIRPLDLGDARLTRHFYALEATPGDLLVTVNSRNLNGDVDIFTAVTFRPLTKISIYANTIPPEVTKSLYFRTRQILILRVEARTPNDDAGAYRITFGGSFQPFSGGIPVAENVEAPDSDDQKTRRVSSVGATIEQPPSEVKPEEPKPAEVAAEKPPEEPAKAPPKEPTPRTTRRNPSRTSRTRPPRTPRPAPAKTETARTDPAKTEEAKPAATEGEEKSAEKPAEKPAAQESPVAGAHLVIEWKDGTRIDRPMTTVRRVIIEGNVIVIILKTGRIERIPMSTVARMAIEP